MRDAIKERLLDAKKRRIPWYDVARALRSGMAEASDSGFDANSLRTEAAQLSGYSVNMLGRMLRVLDYFEDLAATADEPLARYLHAPFPSLELVRRVLVADREYGSELLAKVLQGKARIGELRQATASLTHEQHQAGRASRDRQLRRSKTLNAIRSSMTQLAGIGSVENEPAVVPDLLRCDLIAIKRDEQSTLLTAYGVVYAPGRLQTAVLYDILARCIVTASYFDRYFITFSEPTPYFDRSRAMLEALEASSIGLAFVSDSGTLEVVREPAGNPNPDRRGSLTKLIPEAKTWFDTTSE